jgi:hypothetical protein
MEMIDLKDVKLTQLDVKIYLSQQSTITKRSVVVIGG